MSTVLSKPIPLQVDFDQIPVSLVTLPFFVLWRYAQTKNKWTKVPYQSNGRHAKTTDPSTHTTLAIVRATYETGGFDGIGIVLRDGLCGIDLDHVVMPDGRIEEWAEEILRRFSGTYIERSPGGDGFHILCLGVPVRCGKQGPGLRLEIYDKASPRYLTVTGHPHDL